MHALVYLGNGQYYDSPVFGYYKDRVTDNDQYNAYKYMFAVVWNKDKTRLLKIYLYKSNTSKFISQILFLDDDRSNWNMEDEWHGCVDFLDRETVESLFGMEEQPEDILQRCREYQKDYVYNEYVEITSQKDLDNLDMIASNFHDAYIKKESLEDGKLYLYFNGIWGCDIEIWFWGDLEYDTSNIDWDCPFAEYWDSATFIKQNGFIYMINYENMTVEKITKGYIWFKAKHMMYRIIPFNKYNND